MKVKDRALLRFYCAPRSLDAEDDTKEESIEFAEEGLLESAPTSERYRAPWPSVFPMFTAGYYTAAGRLRGM
jgi:hypothetical protein